MATWISTGNEVRNIFRAALARNWGRMDICARISCGHYRGSVAQKGEEEKEK